MTRFVFTLPLALASAAGFLAAPTAASPNPAGPPALRDLSGTLHQPLAMGAARGTVLLFFADDCPISNSYVPEISRLAAQCKAQNISLYLVNTDAHVTADAVQKHALDYHLTAPTLLDPQHRLAKYAGATVTPEAVVYAPGGVRFYRGRIDNKYVDFGKSRPQATTHDLQDALTAFVAHKPLAHRETKAVGCYI